jgi:HEAT repeat protein
MATSVFCPECHKSLPAGKQGQCPYCRGKRANAAHKPSPPVSAKPEGGVAFAVKVAVFALALVIVLGVGIWGMVHTLRSKHAAAEQPVAVALPALPVLNAPLRIAVANEPVVERLPMPAEVGEPVAVELAPMPALDEPVKVELAPPPKLQTMPLPKLSKLSELALQKQLFDAKQFGLPESVRQPLVSDYMQHYRTASQLKSGAVAVDPFTMLNRFPKAIELQIRSVPRCQLGPKEAATLGVLARKLHAYLDIIAPMDNNGKRADPGHLRDQLRNERRGKRPEWLRPEAIPAMVQILMAQDAPFRLLLVDMLAEIDSRSSTVALAERAVFDLSPEVRQAAIYALMGRPKEHARKTFVMAMRYPWPPVAEHAAEALVALHDQEAAPLLVAQLGKPDPTAPFATQRGASAYELVRINHEKNCLLCHIPATGKGDPVVGIDTFSSRPVASNDLVGNYGGNPAALTASLGGGWSGLWIRADVQFLHQDFSVTFPVLPAFADEKGLRFDYTVHKRPLKPAEVQEWKKHPPAKDNYKQRDAVLFALRNLTGRDVGNGTDAWLKLYPNAIDEANGLQLAETIRWALPTQRDALLAKYRDSKQECYTEALANAIPQLSGKVQAKVRETLVERLARHSASVLGGLLEDDNEDLRHAAALAVIRRADNEADEELLPQLITLLLDSDPEVAEGAHKLLQRLTDQDFGPGQDAVQEQRAAAAAQWQAWLSRQGGE